MDINLNLIDKLSLNKFEELVDRNECFRIVISHKKYDTSHEDDIARYIINTNKFSNLLLIRFEYYISKTFHGLGKGDMVFYDPNKLILYIVELKSLKDKYSNSTDTSKVEKCILQSIRYSNYAKTWSENTCTNNIQIIPVTAIEYQNAEIIITEHNTHNTQTPQTQTQQSEEEEEILLFKDTNNPFDQVKALPPKFPIHGQKIHGLKKIVKLMKINGLLILVIKQKQGTR